MRDTIVSFESDEVKEDVERFKLALTHLGMVPCLVFTAWQLRVIPQREDLIPTIFPFLFTRVSQLITRPHRSPSTTKQF
jgi:hypothetical protein